ncbi:hypothetical protein GCM10009660_31150 [Catellatospora bangladeshensis]
MWRWVAHRIPGTKEHARWRTARAALRWRARSGPPAPAGPAEEEAALRRIFDRARHGSSSRDTAPAPPAGPGAAPPPRASPAPSPRTGPGPGLAPGSAPGPDLAPGSVPGPGLAPTSGPETVPEPGPGPAPAPRTGPDPAPAPPAGPTPEAAPPGGPDPVSAPRTGSPLAAPGGGPAPGLRTGGAEVGPPPGSPPPADDAVRRPHGGFHVLLGDVTAVRAWWWSPLPDTGRGEVTHLAEQRDFLHRVQSTIDATAGGVALGLCTLRLRDLGALTRRFGPEARDRVAATAAARITAAVAGMPAAAVGRLDRDTFGVLITDRPGRHGVTEAVRRLVDRVSEPMRVGHRELVLRPAVGVAEVRGGTTAVQLLARAQVALHSAAEPRAGWREVGSRRGAPDEGVGHLLAALPGALERGEVVLAYTPIVRLGDGRVVGVEASTWWQRPDGSRRQADDLVALADDVGPALRWGPWVLRGVLAQASRWGAALGEAAPRITVNVPCRLARDRELVRDVAAALRESGVAGSQLMLSLPHGAVVDDDGLPRDNLVRLGGMAVPVALEGVGTDFARYDALTRLPLQSVVIPPQLTAGLDGPRVEPSRRSVAANLIRLSSSVSREVTVKGVRTQAQRDTARELSATSGQGELFGGPQSPEDIEHLVADPPIAV